MRAFFGRMAFAVLFCGCVASLRASEPTKATLIIDPAKIDAVRRKIETDPDARAWWEGFRRDVDRRVSMAASVPKGVGQHIHHYTCKSCGFSLPRRTDRRHVCKRCGKEYFGWPYDEVLTMYDHYDRIRESRDCAVAWLLSEDLRYASRAIDILRKYAERYEKWPVHNQFREPKLGGHISAQVLDECVLAVKFAQAYDAVARQMSAEDRTLVREHLLRPMQEIARSNDAGWENHQLWHLSALGLTSMVLGDEEGDEFARNGPHGFLALLNHTVNADGMWNEGAFGYHFYSLDALLSYYVAYANRGGAVPEKLKSMFFAPFRQMVPDGRLPSVNDSGALAFERGDQAEFYEIATGWWDEPLFGWWCAGKPRRTMQYALYGRMSPSAFRGHQLESAALDGTGLAFLHSPGGNCVTVNYDDYGGWHAHHDKLGIQLWCRGERLCDDPGNQLYSSPVHWGWYRTSLAHATLIVDGKRQPLAKQKGDKWPQVKATAFERYDDGAMVVVDGGEAIPNAKAGRAVMLRGSVVLDLVWGLSEGEREWELAFHSKGEQTLSVETGPAMGLPKKDCSFDPYKGDGHDAWAWPTDVREGRHDGVWNASWRTARNRLDLFRKDNAAGFVRTGVTPTESAAKLAVDRVRGKRVLYATVMVLQGNTNRRPAVEIGTVKIAPEGGGMSGFRAKVDGRPYELWFKFGHESKGR